MHCKDTPVDGTYSDIINLSSIFYRDESDVMIGGLYESKTSGFHTFYRILKFCLPGEVSRQILSSSVAYYQDDFTWCVQKSPEAEKWKNVFIIFDMNLWALLIATIFVASLVLTLMIKLDKNRNENFMWFVQDFEIFRKFENLAYLKKIIFQVLYNDDQLHNKQSDRVLAEKTLSKDLHHFGCVLFNQHIFGLSQLPDQCSN